MLSLLKKALTNLDSLYAYFTIMQPLVHKKSMEGKKDNFIGFTADMYFASLFHDDSIQIDKKSKDIMTKIVDDHFEIKDIDKEKGRISFQIKNKKKPELPPNYNVQQASEEFQKYDEMPAIHATNTLVALITRFEEAISEYLYALYMLFPDRIKDKQITFSEISNKTTDGIKEYIIRREVERIMWQSQSEWFKICNEYKINLEHCKKQIDCLTEIYARRNVWVHNSGCVNEIYLQTIKKCKEKQGAILSVDQQYINDAFVCIKIILFTIYIESVKFHKDDADDYTYKIFEYAFDELRRGNYSLCSIVFPILYKCKYATESTKNMSCVNYWIAKKALGQYKSIKEEIEKYDISAMSEEFAIAKYTLLEEYEKATDLIEEVYNIKIDSNALSQWPLFADYRKTEYYKKIRDTHKDDFEIEKIEKTEDNRAEIKVENLE